jgi:hypothetical protein
MISQKNNLLVFGTLDGVELSKMQSFHDVVNVISGNTHTIVVTKTKVYSFGTNKYGQLATGNKLIYNDVVDVTKNINPKSIITCGDYSTTVLYQGKLYAYGWDAYDIPPYDNPLVKFSVNNVLDVYTRDSLTLLLVTEGNKKFIYNYKSYILTHSFMGSLYHRYNHKWKIPDDYHFTQL